MDSGTNPSEGWMESMLKPIHDSASLRAVMQRLDRPVSFVEQPGKEGGEGRAGFAAVEEGHSLNGSCEQLAFVPAMPASSLGDPAFCKAHGLRFPYVAGAMANGISSVRLVEAMGRAGMLGFFGAAGLAPDVVEDSIVQLQSRLPSTVGSWGCNLIYSPYEPALEEAVSQLYIRRNVRLVSASAYLDLTLPLLRYRLANIDCDSRGVVTAPNQLIAKVSRIEVARKFLSPAPEKLLIELVREGTLTEAQARMSASVPVATDLTVEADSGGHTDNRPAIALLPSMLALRDRLQAQHGFVQPLRIGAAGGISTPWSAAAAFAMGAAYILTGSVNQACRESGSSDAVRQMLAEAEQADVIMAPAADMFEMGVKLQVLKRGTLFAMRAQKLYDLYRLHPDIESIPPAALAQLERTVFRCSIDEVWRDCKQFWLKRDMTQIERATSDSRHKMALCFRWYLGRSSRWANEGQPDRKVDYQVWCGPSMGAFNEWACDSFLENWEQRHTVNVAHNILHGAAMVLRHHSLRAQLGSTSVILPDLDVRPRESSELEAFLT